MRPYYADESVTLWLGDCREILPTFAVQDFDLALCDPPYGDTSLEWDKPSADWLSLIAIALTDAGSLWCFGSMRYVLDHAALFGRWSLAQDCVWEKQNGATFHADRFRRVHEHILHLYPKHRAWADVYKSPQTTNDATRRTTRRKTRPTHTGNVNDWSYTSEDGGPRLMTSVLHVPNCHGYAIHPTQKPVGVLVPLIEYSCPPGGQILDPFAGSCSVGVAAKLTGRTAVCIEKDERYADLAATRLSQGVLPLTVGVTA